MNNEVKEIIVDLMEEIYIARGYGNIPFLGNTIERNLFEARMKEIYNTLDSKIGWLDAKTMEDYEEEIDALEDKLKEQKLEYEENIESLEEQVGELASRNEDLAEENCNLRQILRNVSEAVNVTWS